mmetsp:Transcript_22429/g.44024  ORF Transcript_22429/g.44024 Transcript_22429/m.44024 type:complete len:207 (-) Transcript_22429:1050-1670(-)
MRAEQGIETQTTLEFREHKLLPNTPFRIHHRHRIGLGVRGKSFVEPNSIPPSHGDKITKPLMSKLVANNSSDTLLLLARSMLGVYQKIDFTVGNKTPVLHSTHGKFRNGNHVKLGERVGLLEGLVVHIKSLDSDIKSKVTHLLLTRGGIGTDGHTISRDTLNIVKVAYTERQEVCAHARGLLKNELAALAIIEQSVGLYRHVAQCG